MMRAMPTREVSDKLLEAMSRGRVVIVAGAGVTIDQVGSWSGLVGHAIDFAENQDLEHDRAAELRARLGSCSSATDLLDVATEVEHILRDGGSFNAWLTDRFNDLEQPSRLVKAVVEVGRRFNAALATTNYDTLLSDGATVTWQDSSELLRVLRGDDGNSSKYPRTVAHLHGCWRSSGSVIFGKGDYDLHRLDEHAEILNEVVGLGCTLVFVGCGDGLADPHWTELFWQVQNFNARHLHFRLCREADTGQGVKVMHNVVYGDEYPELLPFLEALAKQGPVVDFKLPELLAERREKIEVVAMSSTGSTVATASGGFLTFLGRRRANDLEEFVELSRLPMDQPAATCAAFHSGGKMLAIGHGVGVSFYVASDGTWKLVGYNGGISVPTALAFIADETSLAVCAADLWQPVVYCGPPEQLPASTDRSASRGTFPDGTRLQAVAFAAERWLASTSTDGRICLWSLQDAEPLECLSSPSASGNSRFVKLWASDHGGVEPRLAIAADATRVAVGYADGHVRVYDTRWPTEAVDGLRRAAFIANVGLDSLRPHVPVDIWCHVKLTAAVTALCLSADGETLVTAQVDGDVRVWDISTRDHMRVVPPRLDGGGVVSSLVITADTNTLATAGRGGPARVWDLRP
jgi:hypothetical protein